MLKDSKDREDRRYARFPMVRRFVRRKVPSLLAKSPFFVIPPLDTDHMNVLTFPEKRPTTPQSGRPRQISADHPSLASWRRQPEAVETAHGTPAAAWSISCADCVMALTAACDDCVVSLLVGVQSGNQRGSIELNTAEQQTLSLFTQVGLVPRVRHQCDRSPQRAEKLGA
jgi:hypothetical protein